MFWVKFPNALRKTEAVDESGPVNNRGFQFSNHFHRV